LQVRQAYYRIKEKGIGYNQTAAMLVRLKKTASYGWLQESPSQVLQQSLKDLDKAYQKFFKEKKGFPKFKTKRDKQSVRYPNQSVEIIVKGEKKARLRLSKIGGIRMVMHRPIKGRVMNVTISKAKSGRYYASVCVTCEIELPANKPVREVGIDVGLTNFMVTSEGDKVPPPKYLAKAEKKLKRLQRQVARRVKGSNNREKGRLQLARLHEKVSAQRSNFTHQLSTALARTYTAIAIEDLNVKGMTANHHLAKSIADAA
jgi:putative transposase